VGDFLEHLPSLELKGGASEVERKIEVAELSGKVGFQLTPDLAERVLIGHAVVTFHIAVINRIPIDPEEPFRRSFESERADR
jgi:hypothetical protein